MYKKIFLISLIFLMCLSLSLSTFALTTQHGEEHNTVFENNEEPMLLSETIISGDSSLLNLEEYKFTYKADPEIRELWNGVPDEVLSYSTADLFEYFMQSKFMGRQVITCYSAPSETPLDFSCAEAFCELISRKDFVDVLEVYAKKTFSNSNDNFELIKLEKVLEQPSVIALVSKSKIDAKNYANLYGFYENSNAELTAIGDYVGTVNGFKYYSAGTISTASNLSVEVCTPERELTTNEINLYNSNYAYAGNTRIFNPTTTYNCYSFAWYSYTDTNPYWIMNISNFLNDSQCSLITISNSNNVQVNDIIVYVNSAGNPLHAGVVYDVSSSGELTICSKWGPAGAYIHSIDNVPDEYMANPSTDAIEYFIFRYHDYTYKYTGDEYHMDNLHYYEYGDVCDICRKITNTEWISLPCDGPPCAMPWSIIRREEE